MRTLLPGFTVTLAALAAIVVVVTIGLKIVPAPFAEPALEPGQVKTVPLPAGLPAPVQRYYRTLYGERIPVITSVVMTGRAQVRPFGWPTLNARFRFSHVAGRSCRHYIEATFFGLPLMRINESYVDGTSRFETPMGTEEGEPNSGQAAALGMWAELGNMPATLLTDPRVRWEPLDAETAILAVPAHGTGTERFVVRFDPDTGLVTRMEVMRYQRRDSPRKTLWITESLAWATLEGQPVSTTGSAWWYGAPRPWAVFTTEHVLLNADLSGYVSRRGQ